MTELVAAAAVPPAVRLPPEFRMPKALQAITYVALRRWLLLRLARRYGKVFSVNLPLYGHIVVVGDSLLAKQVLATSPEELGNMEPNLGRLFGPGSIFSLDGEEHRQRRRLLMPLFHGNLMKSYESIIEDETLREVANWPEGQSFPAMPAMAQITLGGILRALFGPECAELDELRRLVPPWVTLGLRIALLPRPRRDYGRYSPWAGLAEMRHQCEIVIKKLIEAARTGPNLAERTDVLALMLRSCYDDGSAMSHNDIVDEPLTMMAAGHETTAATLTWAFERLGRHPDVLAALVEGGRPGRSRPPAGDDPGSPADQAGDRSSSSTRLLALLPARSMSSAPRVFGPPSYRTSSIRSRGLSRPGALRSASPHGGQAIVARMDPIRWRDSPLHRGCLSQSGDRRGATHGIATLHHPTQCGT